MWNDKIMIPAQSTQKSFDVLRALAAHGAAGASLADIADAVALPKPTVHRLLAAMVQQGFALRSATGRRYQLGPEIYALALKSQSTVGLVETWRGALMRVAERTGDSAFLMVRSGYDAVCLAMQEGVVRVRTLTGGTGGRVPLGIGPGSLAILATMTEDESDTILAHNDRRLRMLVPDLPASLPSWVERIRIDGFAQSGGLFLAEVGGVAVPVPRHLGAPECAISTATLASRLDEGRVAEVVAILKEEIAAVLGRAGG